MRDLAYENPALVSTTSYFFVSTQHSVQHILVEWMAINISGVR